MEFNINHLARTIVAGVAIIPLTVGMTVKMSQSEESNLRQAKVDDTKAALTLACIKYQASKSDSKLEREAKNSIDELLGGEVNHGPLCNWVMK
jgi:hypothetical protein